MDNLKVKVNNEAEGREVQELFSEIGYNFSMVGFCKNYNSVQVFYDGSGSFFKDHETCSHKELSIQQLRDLVVLKRNDVGDATHIALDNCAKYFLSSNSEWYCFSGGGWYKIKEPCLGAKPIDKEMKMKEYLDKDYVLRSVKQTTGDNRVPDGWIEVPQSGVNGYNYLYKNGINLAWTENPASHYGELLWQRSETGKVQGCGDNVNNPSHYSDSSIECIDAMEAMLTHDQFIGYLRGNMFKYQWRYQKKNGVEDLKKSQWYLNKLIEKENGNP